MSVDIPIVDFENCGLKVKADCDVDQAEVEKAGEKLYQAFCTSGFAYLSNHGVSSEDIYTFRNVAEKFFDLPELAKRKYYTHDLDFCYDPIGTMRLSAKRGFDNQESFHMTGNAYADVRTLWPEEPREFKETCLKFAETCKQLSLRLLRAIGTGMKLKDQFYLCKSHSLLNQKGNTSMLRAIRYPAMLTEGPVKDDQQLRLAEHSDWACFTMHFQDESGGLQVLDNNGEFVEVSPIQGTIVLNIGDCLQFWSGGRLKSRVHRVVPLTQPENRNKVKRSIAYYVAADDHVRLNEMEFEARADTSTKVVNAGEQRREAISVREYFDRRFDECFF